MPPQEESERRAALEYMLTEIRIELIEVIDHVHAAAEFARRKHLDVELRQILNLLESAHQEILEWLIPY